MMTTNLPVFLCCLLLLQANLMWKPTVCAAMTRAYEEAEGDLAACLLVALEAVERAGGDIRGKPSAAFLVVSGDASEPAWGAGSSTCGWKTMLSHWWSCDAC